MLQMSVVSETSPWRAHEWTIVKSAHQPFDEKRLTLAAKTMGIYWWNTSRKFQRWCKYTKKDDGSNIICFCRCQSKGDIDNEIEGSEWGCGCNYFCTKPPCQPPGKCEDWFTSVVIIILGIKLKIFWIISNWQYITKHNTKSDERLQGVSIKTEFYQIELL